MTAAETVGQYHGTCFYYEESDSDDFLAMMENRMKPESFEKYMDGFMDGKLGKARRMFRHAKLFARKAALDWKTEELK